MIFVSRAVDPAELDRLYGEGYYEGGFEGPVPGYRGYAEEEPVMRRNFDRRLAVLERFTRPGPLLDVGCALGFFVRAAAAHGWEAHGVELSEYAASAAAAQGLRVVHGDFLALEVEPAHLAAVTMLDVLEHVADPRAYVRRAHDLLRPGGVLAVETADLASVLARAWGRRYHFFTPPNHLTYFTRATLGRLLREEGFGRVEFFRVGKWVTVRRLLYHLYIRARRPLLERLVGLAERSGAANVALPVYLGDAMLAVGQRA
jgi:SAM-dependent methyltransferase